MQYSNEMIKTHGVKTEVTRKKNTMDFLMIFKGCKYCMCGSFRICPDIIEKLLILVREK